MTRPQQKDLAAVLEAEGALPAAWAATVRKVDRGLFIPDTTRELDRAADPQAWAEAVYSDRPIVVQWDDGEAGGHGFPTSSSSKPSLMLEMLDLLDVGPDDRVYEIGTATGYNAAWLCNQLSDEQVTTCEFDEGLYRAARKNLEAAGYKPTTIHGDGLLGHPPRAPFTRIMATCALRKIGPQLLAQIADGGRILAPYGDSFHSYSFLVLDVHDGEGVGRFTGNPDFMWARQQRGRMAAISDIYHQEKGDIGRTTVAPYDLTGEPDAEFFISHKVPGAWSQLHAGGEDAPGEATYWLLSDDRESWATVEYIEGQEDFETEQFGPRRLWDEAHRAYEEWTELGRPGRDRFGLTVTPGGEQLWLDEPHHVIAHR
ncbi:protein-L-isoaspartate(D-aspartate) O-methyltransferase (plasmid) [Streptomyces sp. BI20]|uniref:protein-L-isoaspartate(D-aspartate) O-methyltransferase n=1 Tax=Streptomyces sp. BI20 TaxID=3403460 RepID=UPI003C717584